MSANYSFNQNVEGKARLNAIMDTLVRGTLRPGDITGTESLDNLFGGESISLQEQGEGKTYTQKLAGKYAASVALDETAFLDRLKGERDAIKASSGYESFSMALSEGTVTRLRAAAIELNVAANRQFTAAEAMYPTVSVPYGETMLELPIQVAGVGPYNIGGNAFDQFEDFRPLPSILADSSWSSGDDIKLVPVFVDDESDQHYDLFVDKTLWAPKEETYDSHDLLGRQSHLTNYMALEKLNNFMNLCNVPGTPPWEMNDEIDTAGTTVDSLLFKIKTKDGEGVYSLDTSNFSGNGFRTNAHMNARSERPLVIKSIDLKPEQLIDAEGNDATKLFASLGDYKPHLQYDFNLIYHNDTRELTPSVTPKVTLSYLTDKDGNRLTVNSTRTPDDVNALAKAQAVEASIVGYWPHSVHKNTNWSRYGQTIVYASALKQYNVRNQQPISVQYPMKDYDTNTEILARCIKDMGLVISRNMTHDAFKSANRHFKQLKSMNGKKVVGINNNSNDVLAGQHFFTTTAFHKEFTIAGNVSTLDTKDAVANLRALITNQISDVITAIRNRSGFAAIKEIDGRPEVYQIVTHASMAPFVMSSGDVRTFGQNINYEILETNVDSEVGRFWVFPKSQTRDGNIDPLGGLGICVSKELLMLEGDVRMSSRQYRMQICQPAYLHHSLGCIAGLVEITDINDLMDGEGVLSSIRRHLESTIVEKLPETDTDTGDEIEIEPGTEGNQGGTSGNGGASGTGGTSGTGGQTGGASDAAGGDDQAGQ